MQEPRDTKVTPRFQRRFSYNTPQNIYCVQSVQYGAFVVS